jgi:hypothetical protein
VTADQKTTLQICLFFGGVIAVIYALFGWFAGYLLALKIFGGAAALLCWAMLFMSYPWAACILAIAGLGALFYGADKASYRRDEECRAIGGEPIKGRGFYACLAEGAILRP